MTIELKLGDNLELLKTLEDNSIDSCVSDFPYNLSFMGKSWDTIPNYYQWCNDRAKELFRVLKPGAFCLIFSGTRTQHRMVCGFEDAGFEIKDQIMWVYGCYSEDTECLTMNGWKRYNEISKEDYIMQWDKETNNLSWIHPKNIFIYPYSGKMIHIKNKHTDELISPNHKVCAKIRKHSRNSKPLNFEFIEAELIKKNWQIHIPMAGILNQGTSDLDENKAYLVGWWLTDAWVHGDKKACMFSQSKMDKLEKLKKSLNKEDCKYSEYTKTPKKESHNVEHTLYVTGNFTDFLLKEYPNRELTWDVLSWSFDNRKSLFEGLMDGDGSQNKSGIVFWSKDKNRLDIFQALSLSLGFRTSINPIKGSVYLSKSNTTEVCYKNIVEKIEYTGEIWCLETETGAFVIRRNNQVFISGNSGFPKGYNIQKGFDKNGESLLSEQWDGFGTALKPTHEPIMLAQKPIEKNYCYNIKKWGVGGLNIDGSRIELNGEIVPINVLEKWSGFGEEDRPDYEATINTKGRYPANTIFDEDAGKMLDEQSGIGKSCGQRTQKMDGDEKGHQSMNRLFRPEGYVTPGYKDQGGASRFFYCAKSSQKDRTENGQIENKHATVKPTTLMTHLIKLVTPINGINLDICEGSGTSAKACLWLEKDGYKVNHIGFENEEDSYQTALKRVELNKTQ